MNEIQKELQAEILTLGLGSYLGLCWADPMRSDTLGQPSSGRRLTAPAGTWLPRRVAVVFDVGLGEEVRWGPPLDGLVVVDDLL
jgi:hypothetical protein